MNKILVWAGASCATLFSTSALAALSVFACEPEWASLTEALGGDVVSVYQASTAMQDPHHIEARPSLIAKMRGADLVICTGAELETGWLPVLLQTGGNPRVQPGSKGFIAAADYVERLEVPTRLDRAEGDIHPGGNPHIQLDPHNIAKVAAVVSERLASLDPTHAATYTSRGQDFQTRWAAAITHWEEIAAPLKGMRLVPYHKDSVYLIHWLGMVEVMDIEPKPGIPPSAGYLTELVDRIGREGADAIVHSAYQDPKAARGSRNIPESRWSICRIRSAAHPPPRICSALFDDTIARLNQARK